MPKSAVSPAITSLDSLYPVLGRIDAQLRELALGAFVDMQVPAGAIVFDERQVCQGFPFVVSGSIRVAKPAPNGRELPLYRVGPGESCVISTSCLLAHVEYNARGVAESPTRLALMPMATFDALMAERSFRDFVFGILTERIADLMQLVEEVAFRKLDQRLAALLLGHGRVMRTTHQQLADELGSVREIVSRLLKGFAEHGWVQLGREQIEILAPAELRRLAESRG